VCHRDEGEDGDLEGLDEKRAKIGRLIINGLQRICKTYKVCKTLKRNGLRKKRCAPHFFGVDRRIKSKSMSKITLKPLQIRFIFRPVHPSARGRLFIRRIS
jgi:hypothetical protein